MARGRARDAGCGGRSSSPTTAGSSRPSRPRCSSWRREARTTSPGPGTSGGARRQRARPPPRRPPTACRRTSRGSSASSSASGTRSRRRSQAQAKLTQIGRLEKERAAARGTLTSLTAGRRTLGFDFLDPPRTGRIVLDAEDISLSAGDKPLLEEREHRRRARREGRARRAERVGQDDAARGAPRARRSTDGNVASLGHGVVPAYFSQHTQELPAARLGARLRGRRRRDLPRPQAQMLLGRFLFSGWDMHERAGLGAVGRRAAAARARAARRLGRELPRSRRADEPPRPREPRGARGRARGVPGHRSHRLARPRAARRRARTGSSRSRSARSARTTAAGPT